MLLFILRKDGQLTESFTDQIKAFDFWGYTYEIRKSEEDKIDKKLNYLF